MHLTGLLQRLNETVTIKFLAPCLHVVKDLRVLPIIMCIISDDNELL